MKKIGLLFSLLILVQSLHGLTVTPSPSTLNCGPTTVTFMFDCAFSGSVFIPLTTTGVEHNGSNAKVVVNGVTTFDLIVDPSAGSNFSLNFIVIISDSTGTCAPTGTSAIASFTTSCIMPQNNSCANAIPLSISTNSCTPIAFSTTNATLSDSIPFCGIPFYLDLFYTFKANNDTVTMYIPAIPGAFGFYGLYDGCPDSGIPLACTTMSTFDGLGSTYNFTNLIVGTDYHLQLLFNPVTVGTDQEICLYSTTIQPLIPCPSTIDVSDIGPNLPNQSYITSQTITSSGSCILSSNGIVFNAGNEIILNAGFCTSTFDFEAVIGGCAP